MKERFEVLDVFRGIFCTMVVFFHMSAFSNTPILNNPFIYNSDLFVDFFFVLSGFVIANSYQQLATFQQFVRFYKKRFLRLYPLHFIMLLAFLGVELSKQFLSTYIHVNELNNADNNLHTFISSLLLANSVKQPGVQDVSWNLPSWSISAEMIAYFVFGILIVGIQKLHLFKLRNLVYAVVIGLALSAIYAITGDLKLTYSFDYGFLRSLLGFFTGVLCLNVYSYSKEIMKKQPVMLFHIAECSVAFLIPYLVWHKDWFAHSEYIYEVLFFCAIYIFSFEKGLISGLLRRVPVLINIGKYSYSIYMTHALLLSLFNIVCIRLLKLPPTTYAYLFLVNYVLIYYVSKWTYNNIETRFSAGAAKQKETTQAVPQKILA